MAGKIKKEQLSPQSLDLRGGIPDLVTESQLGQVGQRVLAKVDGVLYEYYHQEDLIQAERLIKKMEAEIGWFEKVSTHAPSVGSFYESLLSSAISEICPGELSVGTGFVYDLVKRRTSPQIDVMIYSSGKKAPIYKRREFIVVDSSSVVACVEVKKTLSSSTINAVLKKFLNSNLGAPSLQIRGAQRLHLYAFQSKMKTQTVAQKVFMAVQEFVNSTWAKTESGLDARLIVKHIVLPEVYLFDRSEYVVTHCSPVTESTVKVGVSILSSEGKSSFGEFLSSVISRPGDYIMPMSLLTHPLKEVIEENTFEKEFMLWTEFSISKLIETFPADEEYIKNKKVDSIDVIGALISSSLTKLSGKSIIEVEKSEGFLWQKADHV